jgi:hypothetical protein
VVVRDLDHCVTVYQKGTTNVWVRQGLPSVLGIEPVVEVLDWGTGRSVDDGGYVDVAGVDLVLGEAAVDPVADDREAATDLLFAIGQEVVEYQLTTRSIDGARVHKAIGEVV